jgi:hypothetical protein
MQGLEKLKKLKEKMEDEKWKEKVEKQERDMKAYLKRSAAMKKSWAERKAKKDAQPVKVSARLTYPNKQAYEDRLSLLAQEPDQMTKYEMMCDYFLDKVFWKRFGSGCHTMTVRCFEIKKLLFDGTYKSNSGKSRMGYFTPHFIITNIVTGKVREIGLDAVRQHIELDRTYGKNRRNDPKRNFGLPNSRGYR